MAQYTMLRPYLNPQVAVFVHLLMDPPQLNRTAFAKTNVEGKKNEARVKCKKTRHKEQQFLITTKSSPLFRTNEASNFGHQGD
jgi:hypothetical protein